MRNTIAIVVAVAAASGAAPALAQSADAEPVVTPGRITQASDVALTCAQMADEAAALSARMGQEGEQSLFGMLGGVARSGAEMLIPGAGLVMAGTDAVTQPGREREDAEDAAIRYRWHFLNGMYLGRRCEPPGTTPTVVLRPTPEAPPPVVTMNVPASID